MSRDIIVLLRSSSSSCIVIDPNWLGQSTLVPDRVDFRPGNGSSVLRNLIQPQAEKNVLLQVAHSPPPATSNEKVLVTPVAVFGLVITLYVRAAAVLGGPRRAGPSANIAHTHPHPKCTSITHTHARNHWAVMRTVMGHYMG